MQKGDFGWVEYFGRHPCIVWDPSDLTRVVVVYGTGTARDFPHVCVQPFRRTGKALGLTKPTYFYVTGIAVVHEKLITLTGRPCPPALMLDIETLLQEHSSGS